MPLTLGERLNTYLAATGQPQKAIAAEWLERFQKRNPKESWKLDSVISSLNRCLKEQKAGVKFFFGHEAQRADLLFDVLAIPQAEHDELRRLARECMEKEGDVTCRLVIDATTWSASREHSEALFEALEQMVLQPAEKLKLTPIVLIIVEQQYKWLPRSYDELIDSDALAIEKVKDDKEGWSRVEKLAGDGALVASSRRYQPTERWLAMEDTPKKCLALEPAQGLDLFAKTARLPAPPSTVAHPLHQVAAAATNTKAPVPNRPAELRRLMLALADESQVASLKLTTADRLALSHALGVPATSTERERLEHDLAVQAGKVGIEPKKLTKDEFDHLLARAQRRDVEFSLLRVGDELHVLNPPPRLSISEGPRLKIHRHSSRRPAINRLMEDIDKWTGDDYAADRGLLRVIERLDSTGEERLAFLHARACLLWSNGLCPPSTAVPYPDWKDGLSQLLAGDPPAAQLRLFVDSGDWPEGGLAPFIILNDEPAAAALPPGLKADDPTTKLLSIAPLASVPCLARGQTAHVFDFYRRTDEWNHSTRRRDVTLALVAEHFSKEQFSYHYGANEDALQRLPPILLPTTSHPLREQDLWLDMLECSRAISGSSCDPESVHKVVSEIRRGGLLLFAKIGLSRHSIEIPDGLWTQADQDLALCWLALKSALKQGAAVRLHDGVVLLSLGAGLFANINIRRCKTVVPTSPAESQVRGCMDAEASYGTRTVDRENKVFWSARIDRCQVTTHTATTTGYGQIVATTNLGHELPKLYLAGHGLRAEVTFTTSPLFLSCGGHGVGAPPVATLAAAGTQALAEAQAEDQRQADEAAYDDDDD